MKQRLTPGVLSLLGFGLGVLFGWIVLGWWLAPVRWTDARPADLDPGYRLDYLSMVADSYAANQRAPLVRERLQGFDLPQAANELDGLAARLDSQGQLPQAQRARRLAEQLRRPDFGVAPTPAPPPTPAPSGGPSGLSGLLNALRSSGWIGQLLLGLLGALLIGAAIWLGWRVWRNARPAGGQASGAGGASTASIGQRIFDRRRQTSSGAVQHVSLGKSTRINYERGQEETANVYIVDGASKIIGQVELRESDIARLPGVPPAALQLRLFDRQEPRTRIGCLVSREASDDPDIRQLIAEENEDTLKPPWVISPKGQQVYTLETRFLSLEAEVVDVRFGDEALAPIDTLVLSVTPTGVEGAGEPLDEEYDDDLTDDDDDDEGDQGTRVRGEVLPPPRRPPGM